jgi:putative GTP pyrophosphokinase
MNSTKESKNDEATIKIINSILPDHPEDALTAFADFDILMMRYDSAIREVRTKLEILNDELSLIGDNSPISSIMSRRKKPLSIYEKLLKQENEISLGSIEENLNDVAGIRVICSFVDDIYKVARMLVQQDDITLIEVKDYIKNPKPNGYRSYHMIVEVPVFFSNEKRPMRVEVQIRTVAMDFWASLEHQMRYKKDIPQYKADEIAKDLKDCADTIADTDMRMLAIREKIGNQGGKSRDAYFKKMSSKIDD